MGWTRLCLKNMLQHFMWVSLVRYLKDDVIVELNINADTGVIRSIILVVQDHDVVDCGYDSKLKIYS